MPVQTKVDGFGCQLAKLDDDTRFVSGDISFHRKRSADPYFGQVATEASDRGFLIGLSLKGRHRRRIFHSSNRSSLHDFEENSIYVRNFADDYKADLDGQFGFALMEISGAGLEEMAGGADLPAISELCGETAHRDAMLGGMLNAIFSVADSNNASNSLVVDQLAAAIGVHVMHAYGKASGAHETTKRRRLSTLEENRSKELLASRVSGVIALDELAEACGLSRVAFIRAFRETTGFTPHEWLTRQRIDLACSLLRASKLPLAAIAATSGLGDLSHFTRAFMKATGAAPGAWRRSRQS
ncbi:helix-turn-helix domain-containing protein [Rhizobium grahamii]|uniref:helix-turn-helix domain-containing protein n=1 Tax=Rhizobium grahamii TaxID=1120045 RepID=UPI001FEF8A5B|nr:AraC family transcriptional regulator [Rhizobium grahamii]